MVFSGRFGTAVEFYHPTSCESKGTFLAIERVWESFLSLKVCLKGRGWEDFVSIQLMAAFKSVLVEENKAVYAHVNTVPEQSREGTKGLLSAGSGSLSNSTSHVSILKKPACPLVIALMAGRVMFGKGKMVGGVIQNGLQFYKNVDKAQQVVVAVRILCVCQWWGKLTSCYGVPKLSCCMRWRR